MVGSSSSSWRSRMDPFGACWCHFPTLLCSSSCSFGLRWQTHHLDPRTRGIGYFLCNCINIKIPSFFINKIPPFHHFIARWIPKDFHYVIPRLRSSLIAISSTVSNKYTLSLHPTIHRPSQRTLLSNVLKNAISISYVSICWKREKKRKRRQRTTLKRSISKSLLAMPLSIIHYKKHVLNLHCFMLVGRQLRCRTSRSLPRSWFTSQNGYRQSTFFMFGPEWTRDEHCLNKWIWMLVWKKVFLPVPFLDIIGEMLFIAIQAHG